MAMYLRPELPRYRSRLSLPIKTCLYIIHLDIRFSGRFHFLGKRARVFPAGTLNQ
jgi:hypothetical protein